ncbi:MAG TPA: hypothetical protein VIU65_00430 [Pyrinomonadaceae bacterium]
MSNGKPTCGPQGEPTDDVLTFILAVLGVIGTIVGIIKALSSTTIVTLLGISAPAGVWLSAAGAALVTELVVFGFYYKRCLEDPDGLAACSAGVVNGIEESFNSASDELFPFTAQHNRVDVVVKSIYWFLVQSGAFFVKCAGDALGSPMIQSFYETDAVCAAGLGATIGGGVGVVGGILLGVLAGAAIGCATIILCLLALLIAAIIAAATVIVGAFIGGQIGKAAAGDSAPTETDTGNAIQVGDYITTKGNLITSGDFDGARVYWFVTNTTLHGHSTGTPQFSFTDPDANLTTDACPPPVVGRGGDPSGSPGGGPPIH